MRKGSIVTVVKGPYAKSIGNILQKTSSDIYKNKSGVSVVDVEGIGGKIVTVDADCVAQIGFYPYNCPGCDCGDGNHSSDCALVKFDRK